MRSDPHFSPGFVASILQLIFPGEPPRKLISRYGTRFDVQGMTGVTLEFRQDADGQMQEVVVYTPDASLVVPQKR